MSMREAAGTKNAVARVERRWRKIIASTLLTHSTDFWMANVPAGEPVGGHHAGLTRDLGKAARAGLD